MHLHRGGAALGRRSNAKHEGAFRKGHVTATAGHTAATATHRLPPRTWRLVWCQRVPLLYGTRRGSRPARLVCTRRRWIDRSHWDRASPAERLPSSSTRFPSDLCLPVPPVTTWRRSRCCRRQDSRSSARRCRTQTRGTPRSRRRSSALVGERAPRHPMCRTPTSAYRSQQLGASSASKSATQSPGCGVSEPDAIADRCVMGPPLPLPALADERAQLRPPVRQGRQFAVRNGLIPAARRSAKVAGRERRVSRGSWNFGDVCGS
jgi:hypothetical protein